MRFFIVSWWEVIPGIAPVHRVEVIKSEDFDDFVWWAALQGITFTQASHVITDVPARDILRRMSQ